MTQYVAFLRAINVAGHAVVKMTDLKDAFVTAGCRAITTYIQSGNLVFDLPDRDPAAAFRRILGKLGKGAAFTIPSSSRAVRKRTWGSSMLSKRTRA